MREMILNLEGFQYATSLDLNIGYYHIRPRKKAINLCKIILPWVKYRYKRIPIGEYNYPDTFQAKMNKIFRRFEVI